jgi:hypothetical protein
LEYKNMLKNSASQIFFTAAGVSNLHASQLTQPRTPPFALHPTAKATAYCLNKK